MPDDTHGYAYQLHWSPGSPLEAKTGEFRWDCQLGRVPPALILVSNHRFGIEEEYQYLTFGLMSYTPTVWGTEAVYAFRTRKMQTSVGNHGVDTKRLIGLVWVRMYETFKAYTPISQPKEIHVEVSMGGVIRSITCTDLGGFKARVVPGLLLQEWGLDELSCIDYETVVEGIRVLYREKFDQELRNTGECFIPTRTLKQHLLPDLSDNAFKFFLCHGSDQAVHLADLCKFLWWLGPWLAQGLVPQKLELLYTRLQDAGFDRVLLTHKPDPILKSPKGLAPGSCIMMISSTVPGVLALHVRHKGRCTVCRIIPAILWQKPSARASRGGPTLDGLVPSRVVYVGGEVGYDGPPPELITSPPPKDREELLRLLRVRATDSEQRSLTSEDLEVATGGELLKPIRLKHEIISSSELRQKPRWPPPKGGVVVLAGCASKQQPGGDQGKVRHIRPYCEDGCEDDFDEEVKLGVIPVDLQARRLNPAAGDWRIRLGRPFTRSFLGGPATFIVMIEVRRAALEVKDLDLGSMFLRLHDNDFFQGAQAPLRFTSLSEDHPEYERLPLVHLKTDVKDEIRRYLDTDPKALWSSLPECVTISLEQLQRDDSGDAALAPRNETLDEGSFLLYPIDFTAGFLPDHVELPLSLEYIEPDEPPEWGLLLVSELPPERTITPTPPQPPERWSGRECWLESIIAAFPVRSDPTEGHILEFPDLNAKMVRVTGYPSKDESIFKDKPSMLATVVVFISEGRDFAYYSKLLTLGYSYGLTPVVVVAGTRRFRDEVTRYFVGERILPEMEHALWLEHHDAVGRQSATGQKWYTFAPKDRQALFILQVGVAPPHCDCRSLVFSVVCIWNALLQRCQDSAMEWGIEEHNVIMPQGETGLARAVSVLSDPLSPSVGAALEDHAPEEPSRSSSPDAPSSWTGFPLREVLEVLEQKHKGPQPEALSVEIDPKVMVNLEIGLQQRLVELAEASRHKWDVPFNEAVYEIKHQLRPDGPGMQDGYSWRGKEALVNFCQVLNGAGINTAEAYAELKEVDRVIVSEGSRTHLELRKSVKLFHEKEKVVVAKLLKGFFKDGVEAGGKNWLIGMVTLAAVVEAQPRDSVARYKVGQEVLTIMVTTAASALHGGQLELAWRILWGALDLALRRQKLRPGGGVGRTADDDTDTEGGEDEDDSRHPRSLCIGLSPINPYVLPIVMLLGLTIMSLGTPEKTGHVVLRLARGVLFASERVLRQYDLLLAEALEMLGATCLRCAQGYGTVHTLKEAAARLQAALCIREPHEFRLQRKFEQEKQKRELDEAKEAAQPAAEAEPAPTTSSAAMPTADSTAADTAPSSASSAPTTPDPETHQFVPPPHLAVSIATAYLHLAGVELAMASFIRSRRFIRAPALRRKSMQAYLGAARRKLPKDVSSQHYLVRGIAALFAAIERFEANADPLERLEWWGARDGGRVCVGLDEAEHTLVKRLLLWPERYPNLVLRRLLKRGGEAVVFEGRYKGTLVAAKLPFQKETVQHELDVREHLVRIGTSLGTRRALSWLPTVQATFTDPWPCLVMTFEENAVDLLVMLRRAEEMPVRWVVGILKDAAMALSLLHRANVVHGDVEPRNVMVRKDARVRLIDLGLSKVVAPNSPEFAEDVLAFGRMMRRMLQECRAAEPIRPLWEECVHEEPTMRPPMVQIWYHLNDHTGGYLGKLDDPCRFAVPKQDEDAQRTQRVI
jgi:tRNA A-37 threonylcarbamoyl transferase component Bud32